MDDAAFLSPAEVTRALGVSVKALRLYEQRGLIRPIRSRHGRRAFGPADLARLHQIQALKRLGLSLKQIGELLNGDLGDLAAFLDLQAQLLAHEALALERARALIDRSRARLARNETLTAADIIDLEKESLAMAQSWPQLMRPFYNRHLTEQDRAEAGAALRRRWQDLFDEANRLYSAKVDPQAPELLDLAGRWFDLSDFVSGDNDALKAKYTAAYREALDDPAVAPYLPVGPDVYKFLGPAFAKVWAQRRAA